MVSKKTVFTAFTVIMMTILLVTYHYPPNDYVISKHPFTHLKRIAGKYIPYLEKYGNNQPETRNFSSYTSRKCNISSKYLLPVKAIRHLNHHYVNIIPDHMWTSIDIQGEDMVGSMLRSYAIPSVVHYLWCGNFFKFNHYLSIMSVHKFVRPTKIIFHCIREPNLDAKGYYSYYGEVLRDIPNFYVQYLNSHAGVCRGGNENKVLFMADIISKNGGIYLNENCILSKPLTNLRDKKMVRSYNQNNVTGFVMMVPNYIEQKQSDTKLKVLENGHHVQCASPGTFSLAKSICVYIEKEIFPLHQFENVSDFAQLTRWLYYGKIKPMIPPVSKESLVPLIAHYVLFGMSDLLFLHYICILSSLYILKADVYIHGNPEPRGPYWKKLKKTGRVHFIWRDNIETYFGHKIYHTSHPSDLVRLDVLSRYGGVYVDLDATWVNPLPDNLRQHDFVASVNFGTQKPYPRVFNFGVIIAKPGVDIIKHSLEMYRHFLVRDRPYNPIEMLYKVYEKNPDEIFVDLHLQVVCVFSKCHPTWIKGHLNRSWDHTNKLKFDWKTESLSLHWVYPDPGEFSSEDTLRKSKGLIADIGRHIMKKAGLW